VAVVKSDISDERIASIIRVQRITKLQMLVTAYVLRSSLILSTLITEAIRSSEMPVLRRGVHGDAYQKTAFFSKFPFQCATIIVPEKRVKASNVPVPSTVCVSHNDLSSPARGHHSFLLSLAIKLSLTVLGPYFVGCLNTPC
jgi:hypothetical protein